MTVAIHALSLWE